MTRSKKKAMKAPVDTTSNEYLSVSRGFHLSSRCELYNNIEKIIEIRKKETFVYYILVLLTPFHFTYIFFILPLFV